MFSRQSIAASTPVWYDSGGERGDDSVKWLAVPEYTGKEAALLNMTPVSSSDIASVGYENGTLYIRFHRGGLYTYYNVPETEYRALMSAGSHGRYFHAHIRSRYSYQKID